MKGSSIRTVNNGTRALVGPGLHQGCLVRHRSKVQSRSGKAWLGWAGSGVREGSGLCPSSFPRCLRRTCLLRFHHGSSSLLPLAIAFFAILLITSIHHLIFFSMASAFPHLIMLGFHEF